MLYQNRIKERRGQLRMTQLKLSKLSGISRSAIAEIEEGKHAPSVYMALDLAQALGVTVEWLFSAP